MPTLPVSVGGFSSLLWLLTIQRFAMWACHLLKPTTPTFRHNTSNQIKSSKRWIVNSRNKDEKPTTEIGSVGMLLWFGRPSFCLKRRCWEVHWIDFLDRMLVDCVLMICLCYLTFLLDCSTTLIYRKFS